LDLKGGNVAAFCASRSCDREAQTI